MCIYIYIHIIYVSIYWMFKKTHVFRVYPHQCSTRKPWEPYVQDAVDQGWGVGRRHLTQWAPPKFTPTKPRAKPAKHQVIKWYPTDSNKNGVLGFFVWLHWKKISSLNPQNQKKQWRSSSLPLNQVQTNLTLAQRKKSNRKIILCKEQFPIFDGEIFKIHAHHDCTYLLGKPIKKLVSKASQPYEVVPGYFLWG